jgi:ubiquitin-like domain-containing CTD phosphatase 1
MHNASFCERVFDLKGILHSLTKVPPERQKILGLVKGKLPPDQTRMLVCARLLS